MKKNFVNFVGIIFLFVLASLVSPLPVSAHCDTLDGPVVNAARKAVETQNPNYVLIWVKPEDEEKIKRALKKALKKKKPGGKEFFETLVKVHREGEGAQYEGLKPAGSVEPEIALADKAVETGKLDDVLPHIQSLENREIILHLFHKVQEKSHYNVDDVSAGREFIEAYVVFIHAVEKAIKGGVLEENKRHEH